MYSIILIDDEEVSIESIKQMLPWGDYGVKRIFEATNIEDAKNVMNCEKIDIVVCDIEMAGGDGFEMIRWINKCEYPSVNLFLTCHAEFAYAQKALKMGVMEYILKPVTPEELGDTLRRAIERMKHQAAMKRVQKQAARIAADRTNEHYSNEKSNAEVVRRVKKYIEEHLSFNISREEIAESVFLNKDYQSRVFKDETGLSIIDYVIKEKMNVACELLTTTNLSISKVAECIGYTHMPYFSKLFKKETGMTPNEYRGYYRRKSEEK